MALLACCLAIPAPVGAQLPGQYAPAGIPGQQTWFSDAVLARPRSEYDPLGVRAGDVVIRPALSEGFGTNSNIFGTAHPAGSAFADTRGELHLQSATAPDSLAAGLDIDRMQYWRYPQASHTDWAAGIGATRDLGQDQAALSYSHVTATTGATEIGTLAAGTPVTVALDSAHAGYAARFGRITLEPALDVGIYRFTALAGAASQAANDRNQVSGTLTASYELAPASDLVLVANAGHAAYPTRAAGQPRPDYTDASLLAGIDTRAGTLLRTRAMLGTAMRGYASPAIPDSSAPLAEFDAIWTPTRLTTLTVQLAHSLQNAIATTGARSYADTDARLTLDHELRRNVLVQAFGAVQQAVYQAHGGTQRVASAGGSVTWLLNRRLSLTGKLAWSHGTDATVASLNQTASQAELTLTLRL